VAGAAPAQTAAATVHLGVGKILGIDMAQRVLTISHQDIPGMGMPAMVMDFPFQDSVHASLLSAGQVIAFVLAPHAGGIAVTAAQAVATD
jgi:Cu/Ag efflux protein CusF